ncbi:hypothetical protein AC1031_000182 [Aphanomyces cochlioides]|nr:hypothetical protein AC1031_000182 [Aphanomyces cochlioides]
MNIEPTLQSNACPQGYYCPIATPSPVYCPAGTYNNVTGQDALQLFPKAHVLRDTIAHPCQLRTLKWRAPLDTI